LLRLEWLSFSLPRAVPSSFETSRTSPQVVQLLAAAAVQVAIAEPYDGAVRELRWDAGFAADAGLPYSNAIAAVTTNVQQILGLPGGVGAITTNNQANFVVFSGDPLSLNSKVLGVALGSYFQCNPVQY